MCESKDKIPLCWHCRFIVIVFFVAVLGMWAIICFLGKPETDATLNNWITVLIFLVTIVCTAIPLYMNNRYSELEKNLKKKIKKQQNELEISIEEQRKGLESKIEEQRQSLESITIKLQDDFKDTTQKLIQNEKDIELKLRFQIFKLLYNQIQSNVSVYKANKLKKTTLLTYLFISYILFYQLLWDVLYLIKNDKYKKAAAYIADSCFSSINKAKPMLELYDQINGGRSYKDIFILIQYRDLFDSKLIEFLEEVKKREEGESSAAGEA